MSALKRFDDADDHIEQYRARGFSKEDTAKRLLLPLRMVESVWARMDAAASNDPGADRLYRKRGERP